MKHVKDQLANDRTLLSQVRVAVALVSLGVSVRAAARPIEEWLASEEGGAGSLALSALGPLALAGIMVGGFLLCWAGVRHALFSRALRRGADPRRLAAHELAALVAFACLVTLLAVVTIRAGSLDAPRGRAGEPPAMGVGRE